MSGGRHKGGFAGAPQAARALLLAGCLFGGPAGGQTVTAPVSPEMADQKARMLEGFFASPRLSAARESKPGAVAPLESEARARLEAGRAALVAGQYGEAMAEFDAGIRAVSRAVALGTAKKAWDGADASVAFVARRRQANSYLEALADSEDIAAADHREVARLRGQLDAADGLFAAGTLEPARTALDATYREIVALVSEIRRGHSVFVARTFASPAEEFVYERERHHSYRLLVQIALAERSENQPSLAALAARLGAESDDLLAEAERQAAAGDYPTAIGTMESATARLLVVLRAAGLIMLE